MTQAREALSGRWGLAVGTFFCIHAYFYKLSAARMPIKSPLLVMRSSFIPLLVTGAFSLAISRKEEANLEMIFSGFKYYGKTLGVCLLEVLFVLFWMLLLIVPCIIAAISYSLAFYIMSDDPNIGTMEAIDKSKKMMWL